MLKNNKQKGFAVIAILAIVMVLGVAGGIGYWVFTKQQKVAVNEKVKTVTPSPSATPEPAKNTEKYIYYGENNNLFSVGVTSKSVKQVDSGITYGGGATGFGTADPINAPDLSKAAYIKQQAIWVNSGDKSYKISQPTISKNAQRYSESIAAWSPSSKDLVFTIVFSCGMDQCGPTETEDKNITGVYWYSFDTNKSTKLPIDTVEQWLPGTNKLVYFKDITNGGAVKKVMHTYDLVSQKDELLSQAPFLDLSGYPFDFSDDGKKLVYLAGDAKGGTSSSSIVLANIDNTSQKEVLKGAWADFQWPKFVKNSNTNFVYQKDEKVACTDGGGTCPKGYLVESSSTKKLDEIISILGNYDETSVITVSGYSYDRPTKGKLTIVNTKTGDKNVLYQSKDSIALAISH